MPPAAATAAGRAGSAPRAPQTPRRVSGPATKTRPATQTRPPARHAVRTTARAAAAAAALENALSAAPTRPRRESPRRDAPRRESPRPRRPSHETRPPRVRGKRRTSFALGLAATVVPNHRWLDRIVRGRAWIPLLGAVLVAIVGLRVEVLKLGSSVGREIQQVNALQSSDQILRSRVSELSGNQRIEQLASAMGMVMPGPMDIHFVQASSAGRVANAIRDIRRPAAAAFLSSLVAERAADTTNTIQAANTSAAGVQSTNDPGTVTSGAAGVAGSSVTSASGPTGVTAGTVASTTASTTGVTTTPGTTDSTSGGTSAGTTPPTTPDVSMSGGSGLAG